MIPIFKRRLGRAGAGFVAYPPTIVHTSTSATYTVTLGGQAGKFVTLDWGDGSAPTTLELAPGGKAFIHDFSGGSGSGIIRIYGALGEITYIDAKDNNISNIQNFQYFLNLTTLHLYINSISDISTLVGLTSLDTLYLNSNSISDISDLAGLTSLTDLRLSSNGISDISALVGLTSLTDLRLYNNSISDISDLAGLTNLTTLHLYINSISDISTLVGLTSLDTLYVYNNNVTYTTLSWPTYSSGTFRFDSTVDSAAEVDQMLADYNTALWANLILYVDGTNPAPTGGAAQDIADLIGRGVTLFVSS